MSLAGLRHAMAQALARHRAAVPPAETARPAPRTVDELPAARRLPATACVHCHHVYDFRREALQAAGKWQRDELWVYPLPENVGITLVVDEGDRVAGVRRDSPAWRAGLRGGDRLRSLDGRPVASFADVQYALHRAPAKGKVALTWSRAGSAHKGELVLGAGWRQTDLSWRWSLRGVDPPPWVHGEDLNEAEKKALGLAANRLAFRQGGFVSQPARQAGLRAGDVIIGIDGKRLEMTARQFAAHVRLNYQVGDRVTYNLLRDGKRMDVMLRLLGRPGAR
jgi:S1-C subfamily serine protease